MLQAEFSPSLRSRPEWHTLGPALVASASYKFQGEDDVKDTRVG